MSLTKGRLNEVTLVTEKGLFFALVGKGRFGLREEFLSELPSLLPFGRTAQLSNMLPDKTVDAVDYSKQPPTACDSEVINSAP